MANTTLTEKNKIKQEQREIREKLSQTAEGYAAFYKTKCILITIAFALRVAINLAVAIINTVAGSSAALTSTIISLFIVYAFYVLLLNGDWKTSVLLYLWAGLALVDSVPLLAELKYYYLWVQIIVLLEFIGGVYFLAVALWQSCIKKNRTLSVLHAKAMQSHSILISAANALRVELLQSSYHTFDDSVKHSEALAYIYEGNTIKIDFIKNQELRVVQNDMVIACYNGRLPKNGVNITFMLGEQSFTVYAARGAFSSFVYLFSNGTVVSQGKI